jgi:hypothetical protein
MADIVIINPRFDISFWGLEHCVQVFGKRANLPVANLALLAALVPNHHKVTLIDENVEDIDFERVGQADIVCLTGMSIQGRRLIEIITEVKSRAVMTVVGGPMATVEPESLDRLADAGLSCVFCDLSLTLKVFEVFESDTMYLAPVRQLLVENCPSLA